jgi:hypothetical protein
MPTGAIVGVVCLLTNQFRRIGYQGVGAYTHGNNLNTGGGVFTTWPPAATLTQV